MHNAAFSRLYEAAGQVLASMVSMAVKPATANQPFVMQPNVLDVRIVYQGDRTGVIGLVLERILAKHIAARMLGLQSTNDILDDMIDDAASELINVIGGHFLTMTFGEKPVLNMSVPLITRIDGKTCRRLLVDKEACPFRVDDFPVLGIVKMS